MDSFNIFGWLMKRITALVCSVIIMAGAQSDVLAATPRCTSQKTKVSKTKADDRKADRTLSQLERAYARLVERYDRKVASLDNKALQVKARADSLGPRLSTCNATSSFVDLIWNDPTATSATCQANNTIIGTFLGSMQGQLNCAIECAVGGLFGVSDPNCQANCTAENAKRKNRETSCRNRAAGICGQIISARVKHDGYISQKAQYNSQCTGPAPSQCPNGALRALYIKINGPGAAKDKALVAQAKYDQAIAELACCQENGIFTPPAQCAPRP